MTGGASGYKTVDYGSGVLWAYEFVGGPYASVDWNGRELYARNAAYARVLSWYDGKLWDGQGPPNQTADWILRTLDFSYWTITDATNITDETYASGSFRVAGGLSCGKSIQCDKYQLLDDKDNYWSANCFSAITTDNIILNSPAILYGNTAAVGITLANWTKVGGVIGSGITAYQFYANTGSSTQLVEVMAKVV
jgi:hypothetical protein